MDGPAPAVDAVIRPAASPLPALRTVLVAEHDPAVRAMVACTLQLLGYVTVSAAGGEEALALAGRHAESLALLIAAIPTLGPGGPELAGAVGALPPRTPVLFTSGERAPRDLSDLVVGRPATFLPKPFSADELSRAVRELMT